MDLRAAVQKHAEWKIRFREAITKKALMDAAKISRDDCCEIGMWLHSEGGKQFGQLPAFVDCKDKHAVFHKEAGQIALAINAKDFAKADELLRGQAYNNASAAVGVALTTLRLTAKL